MPLAQSSSENKYREFYTVKEAAALMGYNVHTIWRWARTKKQGMPVKQFGRNFLIPKKRFLKWSGLDIEGEKRA